MWAMAAVVVILANYHIRFIIYHYYKQAQQQTAPTAEAIILLFQKTYESMGLRPTCFTFPCISSAEI